MLYIVIGNALVFMLSLDRQGPDNSQLFHVHPQANNAGRGVAADNVHPIPPASNLFTLLLSLYFYYMVGSVLEREWAS